MSRRYPVPAKKVRCELTVKGSRFIATAARVRSAKDASAFIGSVKSEFPDASHNCSTFLAGAPGDSNRVGMSDDGEPSGTAGRPMLATLLHSGIGELAVVVTRYFGGTRLGKGGLVRAYTRAVQDVLEKLPLEEIRSWAHLALKCDYSDLEKTKMLIHQYEGEIDLVDYTDAVQMRVRIPEESADDFVEGFRQATCGKGDVGRNGG